MKSGLMSHKSYKGTQLNCECRSSQLSISVLDRIRKEISEFSVVSPIS